MPGKKQDSNRRVARPVVAKDVINRSQINSAVSMIQKDFKANHHRQNTGSIINIENIKPRRGSGGPTQARKLPN